MTNAQDVPLLRTLLGDYPNTRALKTGVAGPSRLAFEFAGVKLPQNAFKAVVRGEYDGIAGFDDLVEFFKRLPNADKQFAVMAGISHASFQQKNYRVVYHILQSFFSQPDPVYRA